MGKLLAVALALLAQAAWPAGHGLAQEAAGTFVAVGYNGRRMLSFDGVRWENDQQSHDPARAPSEALLGIVFGAGRFVAVGGGTGNGRIISSLDGKSWKQSVRASQPISTISFGNNRFVAFSGSGLLTSTDGDNFEVGLGRSLEWKGVVTPRRSACGDTEAGFRFVVLGDIDLEQEGRRASWRAVVGDTMRWDHAALDTAEASDVAYGAGLFVVVGPKGLIESSHDGQTWVKRAVEGSEDLLRVVWTGERFLASSRSGLWSSADGMVWAKQEAVLPCALVWAREKFPAIGLSWDGLWVSEDLVRWKKTELPAGPPLQAVAFGRVSKGR